MNLLVWNTICEMFSYGIYVWVDVSKLINDYPTTFENKFDAKEIEEGYIGKVDTLYSHQDIGLEEFDYDEPSIPIEYCKPILRPLSSITEEESEHITNIVKNLSTNPDSLNTWSIITSWFNSRHLDTRHLIESGTAISTEKYNPYEE